VCSGVAIAWLSTRTRSITSWFLDCSDTSEPPERRVSRYPRPSGEPSTTACAGTKAQAVSNTTSIRADVFREANARRNTCPVRILQKNPGSDYLPHRRPVTQSIRGAASIAYADVGLKLVSVRWCLATPERRLPVSLVGSEHVERCVRGAQTLSVCVPIESVLESPRGIYTPNALAKGVSAYANRRSG